jgi:hypothetical protein
MIFDRLNDLGYGEELACAAIAKAKGVTPL